MLSLVTRLEVADKKVLVLTDGVKPNVFLSGRNLPNVHVMPYTDSSTYHILWSDVVLVEAGAIGQTLAPIAEEAPARKEKTKAPAKAAVKKTITKGTGAKSATSRAAAKRAGKAPAAKKSAAKKTTAKKSAAKKSTKKKGK
jgi:hypothetical protein